jgi:hypothetical protein
MVAPQAFQPDETDDWGRAIVQIPEPDPANALLLRALDSAIGNCPEQAISLIEEGSRHDDH